MRAHSLSGTRPLRSLSPKIRPWLATKRWASSVSDISSENIATARPWSMAAFSAMLVTNALLPMLGRAATMMRLPGWKPPVISSRSLKPDGVPVSAVPSSDRRCIFASSSWRISSTERKSAWRSSWATSRTARSARSTRSRAGSLRSITDAWIS